MESDSTSEVFISENRELIVGYEAASVTLECLNFENIYIDWEKSITSDFSFIEENDTVNPYSGWKQD